MTCSTQGYLPSRNNCLLSVQRPLCSPCSRRGNQFVGTYPTEGTACSSPWFNTTMTISAGSTQAEVEDDNDSSSMRASAHKVSKAFRGTYLCELPVHLHLIFGGNGYLCGTPTRQERHHHVGTRKTMLIWYTLGAVGIHGRGKYRQNNAYGEYHLPLLLLWM